MRAALKSLQKDPCRVHKITDEERAAFAPYSHLQRYFPALDMFVIPDDILSSDHANLELPSQYQISEWITQDRPKFWKALRREPSGKEEPCEVFTKIVHLLNPIDMIKDKFVCPPHPLLPQSENMWKTTLLKLHSHNNQAYVDAVANYVLSRFREMDLTPHCILSYGCFTGISDTYTFNITPEYDSYRQCRWFWKGMASHSARLTVQHDPDEVISNFDEIYQEITTCPFSDSDEDYLEMVDETVDHSDTESIRSITFDTIEDAADNTVDLFLSRNPVKKASKLSDKSDKSDVSDASDASNESDDSEESEESDDGVDVDICLEIPNMPIILIAQEAQEGVMDALMDEEEIDGCPQGSQGWEARWIAWLFQVTAALSFLQSTICFTHNDLHSNNILWRKTDKRFLYYRAKDGTVWRVPTFGKIFTIIDFGRSIFRLGKRLWVSDDHWPEQDAGDQYNFGPFFNPNKPKHMPNPSFDLCRLAVSLLDGLFEEIPAKKKGKGVSIMSQEGSWKVYETRSPLYNLLWSWTVDDQKRTVYEDEEGEEKYEGFELYIRIAQDVHNVVPKDQLRRPIFEGFIWKDPVEEKIYDIGA